MEHALGGFADPRPYPVVRTFVPRSRSRVLVAPDWGIVVSINPCDGTNHTRHEHESLDSIASQSTARIARTGVPGRKCQGRFYCQCPEVIVSMSEPGDSMDVRASELQRTERAPYGARWSQRCAVLLLLHTDQS